MGRLAGIFLLSALCALTSCKDDEKVLTPLPAPEAGLYQATVSSLTFYWDKVANATQYAYELLDPEGDKVTGGVTEGTVAVLTGLKDNTDYKFTVWAYGPFEGDYSKSPVAEISGTTPAIVQLATPKLTVLVNGGAVATWDEVPNATHYVLTISINGGKESSWDITGTEIMIGNLSTGTYTVTLKAVSDDEAFSDSELATATFVIEKKEAWRVDGTFDDGAGNNWPVTMIAWDNGTYTLKDWYNVEGYDLEFSVNDDTSISILNYYEPYLPNIWVEAGIEEDNGWIQLYTATSGSDYYSQFNGDKSKGGSVWFYSYKTEGYPEFTWTGDGGSLIDDLVGTYSQNSTGSQIFDGSNWVDFTSTNDVVIEKIDDNTVSVTGLLYEDNTLKASVDAEAKTLTFEPQTWLDWYVFCVYDSPTTSVVATIADGVITMSNWTAYSQYSDLLQKAAALAECACRW